MIKLEESLCTQVFYSLTYQVFYLWIYSESTGKPLSGSQEELRLLINIFEEIPWLLTKHMEGGCVRCWEIPI